MTVRLYSAGVRADLVGLDLLPAEVTSRVRGVLSQLAADGPSSDAAIPRVTTRVTGPRDAPHLDGARLPDDPDRAAAMVVAAVDRAVLAATPCLTVHAAVLAGRQGAAILPADSGAGKSTLAGAGQQRGLLLVSDEAACLDPDRDVLWPHPRPLGLDHHSRALLSLPAPDDGPAKGERATAPSLLGAVAPVDDAVTPCAVVLPERRAWVPAPSLAAVGASEALAALLARCLNTHPDTRWDPERAWRRLVRLVRTVDCYRLVYASPQDGAETLAALLE